MTRRRRIPPLAVLASLLVLAALAIGAVGLWRLVIEPQRARDASMDVAASAQAAWSAEPSPTATAAPAVGDVIATIRVPALGDDAWPVAVGTGTDQLATGFGWYEWTASPGAVGNFAIAGLRLTGPQPLREVTDLAVGDEVVVETATQVLTYRLVSAPSDLTVQASDQWVLDPVPGQDEVPLQSLITITTSEDLIPTGDRTVVFGVLDTTEQK